MSFATNASIARSQNFFQQSSAALSAQSAANKELKKSATSKIGNKSSTSTRDKRATKIQISATASSAEELYYAPGGQICAASEYKMTSTAFGSSEITSYKQDIRAGMVMPRSEAGDPFQMLLRQRIVMLGNQVDDFIADAIISQLLLLNQQDPTKEIKLFINSPGGSVTAGMGIYDAMQFVQAPVGTVCMGLAASMGAFLLTAGEKGKRLSMPNARIMIHQPLGGASGQAVDIEIQAKEMMYHKGRLNQLMAFHSGQPVEKIDADTDRDRYMSPLEAKNYGLIDEVIGGDDAGLKIDGEMADFKKTKAQYVAWGNK
jgi:ATP-dependent Clp protease, protease subunit